MSTNVTEFQTYRTLDFFLTTAAIGAFSFPANPSANDTITLNGTVVTLKASGAVGNQVNIGANRMATTVALAAFLNASADAQISKNFYWAGEPTGQSLLIVSKTPGSSGNTFTTAASAATPYGATLQYGGAWSCVSTTYGQASSSFNKASAILAEQAALIWARGLPASSYSVVNFTEPLVGGGNKTRSTILQDGLSNAFG